MSDETDEREHAIIRRQFDPTHAQPERDVVRAIAELENRDPTALSALYPTIDDVLKNVFSDPPAPEAQIQITFTYEGYRITVSQDGDAEFVKVT